MIFIFYRNPILSRSSTDKNDSYLFNSENNICPDCGSQYTDYHSHLNTCGEQEVPSDISDDQYRRAGFQDHTESYTNLSRPIPTELSSFSLELVIFLNRKWILKDEFDFFINIEWTTKICFLVNFAINHILFMSSISIKYVILFVNYNQFLLIHRGAARIIHKMIQPICCAVDHQ